MEPKQSPATFDLAVEEKEVILRALSFYQIHLFDELNKPGANASNLQSESRNVTGVIKKIHKTMEHKEKKTTNQ